MKKSNLKTIIKEEAEQWTGRDLINLKKQIFLTAKSLNGATRNLQKLEKMMERHQNKPQGNTLFSMSTSRGDQVAIDRVLGKVNKLVDGLKAVFSQAWEKA